MTTHSIWLLAVWVGVCAAQGYYDYQTTPIPILKQINKHNEDGSYSYGYEGADGSFKIETKHPTGEVFGKYGYVDDTGATREVEYGASRRGFEPSGSGINVPPPTLQNTYSSNSISGEDGDDGQYREDPTKYYKNQYSSAPQQRYQNTASYNQPQHYNQPQQHYNQPQQRYNQPQQHYNQPQQHYNQPQQHYNQPQHDYNHQQYNQRPAPVSVDPNLFIGHPATGFDVNTGSYSVNYSG